MWKNYNELLEPKLRKFLGFSLLLSFCEIVPILAVTVFIQHALNRAVPQNDMQALLLDGLGVILATVFVTALALGNNWLAVKISRSISKSMQEKIIEKSLRINPIFYHQNKLPTCNHSIVHDAEKFHTMSVVFLVKFTPSVLVSISISIFLFFINVWLALILFVGTPIFVWTSHLLERKLKRFTQLNRKSIQTYSEGIRFLFDMMDLIQTHSTEALEAEKQKKHLEDMGVNTQNVFWFNSLYNLSQNFLVALLSIGILIVGGAMVIQQSMLWGHLIAFYVAVGMLKKYAQSVISSIPYLIEGNLCLSKLNAFLQEPENIPYQGEKPLLFKGSVRFEAVDFAFHEKELFQNVNFSIEEGEMVALLGPNGSGKSTIANLLLGFYRPQKGKIYFDQCALEELDLKKLRTSIGMVRQNPLIFPGTVGENILYGSPFVSVEEMEEVVGLTDLMEFVQSLPLKFDTPTGVSGLHLSGGQRQKIALARALLRQPKLLILDEPTNHLDTASIRSILSHLKQWKQKMSILMISHHPELASFADKTYHFKNETLIGV